MSSLKVGRLSTLAMYLYENFTFSHICELVSFAGPDRERVYRARKKAIAA
ncbi:hypothetical protein ACOAPY_09720 [Pseudomonas sp. P3C3]